MKLQFKEQGFQIVGINGSKMENNDKPVSRAKLKSLAKFYHINEKVLLPYWLAEKVLTVVHNEDCATDALKIVLTEIDKK